MARIAITDTGGLDFTPGIAVLDAAGHDTILLHEGEGLLTHLADLEGLIVSFCRIDASVIAAAPLLKVIVTTTTGLDQIDMHAAKAAGMKKGDIITKLNGVTIKSSPELQEQIARYKPSDKISVQIKRDGKEMTFNATLKAKIGDDANLATSSKAAESSSKFTAAD